MAPIVIIAIVAMLVLNSNPAVGTVESKAVVRKNETISCKIETSGFCLPKKYDKFQKPNGIINGAEAENGTINVKAKFMVEQITDVEDKEFTISILTYLSLYWADSRLEHKTHGTGNDPTDYGTPEDVPLTFAWADELWQPDVFVEKMQSLKVVEILEPFGSRDSSHG